LAALNQQPRLHQLQPQRPPHLRHQAVMTQMVVAMAAAALRLEASAKPCNSTIIPRQRGL